MTTDFLIFIPQAFITALATIDKDLSPDMIKAIQAVGQDYQAGNIEALGELENIAELDPDFHQVYENAYEQLLTIDGVNERNKHEDDSPIPRELEKEDNFLAPILTDINPSGQARNSIGFSLQQSIEKTAQWVYQNVRLP